jgi:hypothetical protein
VLEDGDLLVLGPRTNAQLKQAVLPIKDASHHRAQWRSCKPRISVVLRYSKTQMSLALAVAKILTIPLIRSKRIFSQSF